MIIDESYYNFRSFFAYADCNSIEILQKLCLRTHLFNQKEQDLIEEK